MKLEGRLESKLLKHLESAFSHDDWTFRHTLSSVDAMKKIVGAEWANEKVLVTAMYLHDIGYATLLKKDYSLDDRINAKKEHMEIGAADAKNILKELKYSQEEIEKIVHLISVHDKLDELSERDELLVLEADSIAQIDPRIGNTFSEEEVERFVRIFEEKRVPKFITRTGKRMLEEYAKSNGLYQKYTKLFKL
jgi:hypothetical protein